jgi:hypothetical protein
MGRKAPAVEPSSLWHRFDLRAETRVDHDQFFAELRLGLTSPFS